MAVKQRLRTALSELFFGPDLSLADVAGLSRGKEQPEEISQGKDEMNANDETAQTSSGSVSGRFTPVPAAALAGGPTPDDGTQKTLGSKRRNGGNYGA